MVKTSPSNAGGVGLIPGQGAKIPHALWPKNQNIKQKQYCNKCNKDFKTKKERKRTKTRVRKKAQKRQWRGTSIATRDPPPELRKTA